MGLLDLFSDTDKSNSSSKGGFIRSYQAQSRVKPGVACFYTCWIDDERCQECLAEQAPIERGLKELRQIENAIANPEILNEKRFEKCTLCGAPYEKGETECPYCGSEYPANAALSGLPNTVNELKQAALNKAVEVWELYVPLFKKHLDRLKGEGGMLFKMSFNMLGMLTEQTMMMSAQQLQQGAQKYNVELSDYMCGVMNGSMESITTTQFKENSLKYCEEQSETNKRRLQESKEKMDKYNEEQRIIRERQHQQEMERLERQRQSNEYIHQLQMNKIANSAPKYVGSPASLGYCCGNCIHYMSHSNECAYSKYHHPSNASDYCGDHRSR